MRHHDAVEAQVGQLVVHAAVLRILHGQHPFEVPHRLVEDVGYAVAGFGDADVLLEERRVMLEGRQQRIGRDAGVDHVFVVVAGVIPALGAGQHGASRPRGRCGGGVHLHLVVRMAGGTSPSAGNPWLKRDGAAVEIERLQGRVAHGAVAVGVDRELVRQGHARDPDAVGARAGEAAEVEHAHCLAGRLPAQGRPGRSLERGLAVLADDLELPGLLACDGQLLRLRQEAELVDLDRLGRCRPGDHAYQGQGQALHAGTVLPSASGSGSVFGWLPSSW